MNKVINYSMYANLPYRQEDVMDLKGRDFLTLKDYTPEEILYLIDLAAELKDKKKKGIVEHLSERMLHLYLRRQVQEHAAHLR